MSLRALTGICEVRASVNLRCIARSYPTKTRLRPLSSTTTKRGKVRNDRFTPFFVTALASRPREVIKPSALTGKPRLRHPRDDREYLLVFLVTPETLNQAKDEETLIRGFLQHHFQKSRDVNFSVLVAVVDAIPLVRRYLSEHALKSTSNRGSGNPLGYPGISVAVLELHHAAPDIWSDENVSTPQQLDEGAFPHLSFNFSDCERQFLNIQLPLANTLFKNGQTSTMYLRRWSKIGTEKGNAVYTPQPPVPLLSQTININHQACKPQRKSNVATNSILRSITKPRSVAAASGNVIRSFMTDSGAQEPASQELEDAIYGLSRDALYAGRPIEVWALVTSKARSQVPTTPQSDATPKFDVLGGSSMFKVLSGGGGWGEKRGLLSLGSTTDFQGHSVGLAYEGDSSRHEIYPNFVKPGDQVTFAIVDADKLQEEEGSIWSSKTLGVSDKLRLASPAIQFGCIPSMIDEMPSNLLDNLDVPEDSPQIWVQSFFGALSSRGLHLSTAFGKDCKSSDVENQIKTNVDAPYTTFSIYRTTINANESIEGRRPKSSAEPTESGAPGHKGRPKDDLRNEESSGTLDGLYRSTTSDSAPLHGSIDGEGVSVPAESLFSVKRYTSMTSEANVSQPHSDLAEVIEAGQHMDDGRRKIYTDALLQGLPAVEALNLAGIGDDSKQHDSLSATFRIHKHAWNNAASKPSEEASDKTAIEKLRDTRKRLKARSGYFFGDNSRVS